MWVIMFQLPWSPLKSLIIPDTSTLNLLTAAFALWSGHYHVPLRWLHFSRRGQDSHITDIPKVNNYSPEGWRCKFTWKHLWKKRKIFQDRSLRAVILAPCSSYLPKFHSTPFHDGSILWKNKMKAFYITFCHDISVFSPGWCGLVGWTLACKQKGHQFDSQSGHMPGL